VLGAAALLHGGTPLCFVSAVKSFGRGGFVLYLLYGFALPVAVLCAVKVPAEYILYASAALLVSNSCCTLTLILLVCRLFGLPVSRKLFISMVGSSSVVVSVLTSVNFRVGVEPGPGLLWGILWPILLIVYPAFIIVTIIVLRRCLPRCLEGVEKACRLCEETVDLHFVASAKGLRVETVYPEPGWGGLWKSAVMVNVVYLVFLLPPVYAAAPGMLLPAALAGVAVAALFTAVRVAISRRVGEPLCFRYASLPVQLAFLTLLLLDLAGVLRGAVIPASPGPSIIVIPAAEFSAAHTAMILIDLYVAAKGRGKCGKFFGMCVGDTPWVMVVGQPHTAEAGGP